jgi:inosine-uridine nucleoside N-ribohydrolase
MRKCAQLVAAALFLAAAAGAQSVPVIFDTDMGNDIDDALALAMLHAFESRGECRIIGVTVTKDNPWAPVYVDLLNTFYGRAHIPVGMVNGSRVTPENSPMIQAPSERRRADGTFVYPRRLGAAGSPSVADAPEAAALLRRLLTAEKDGSVVIVQVGFSTNLAHLLAAPADLELVRRKVKLLSIMAGNFAQPKPEFNVQMDTGAARKLFDLWPGEIVASGFEIGESLLFPAASIEHDFSWTSDHPVAEAYRNYKKMPYDRPTWDLTAALYAIRPDAGYFGLSPRGRITSDDAGRTAFHPDAAGRHRYLTLTAPQRIRTLECMIQLASQPTDK